MVSSRATTALLLALAANVQAHFKLNEPESIGFSDDEEGTAPCGSFTPNFSKDKITEFHVGGQAIALLSTHPESKWLFRATFDESAKGDWQKIYPIVDQKGLGDFCIPTVTVPDSWVGKTGVIGVAVDAPDGTLYQCASVKFVEGTESPSKTCKNGTDVTGSFIKDDTLEKLAPATITPPANATSGSESPATSSDTKDNAGSQIARGLTVSSGAVAAVAALFCAGYGF